MTDPIVKEVHASVPTLGVPVEILYAAESERDIEAAFKNLSQGSGAALLVTPNGFFLARRALIVTLAARHAIPTVYWAHFRQLPFQNGSPLLARRSIVTRLSLSGTRGGPCPAGGVEGRETVTHYRCRLVGRSPSLAPRGIDPLNLAAGHVHNRAPFGMEHIDVERQLIGIYRARGWLRR